MLSGLEDGEGGEGSDEEDPREAEIRRSIQIRVDSNRRARAISKGVALTQAHERQLRDQQLLKGARQMSNVLARRSSVVAC